MRRAFTAIAVAIAVGFGLVVLIGYFIPPDLAQGFVQIRILFIDLAVTLAGFATLVGIAGLLVTHWRKLRARRNPDRYSLLTVLFFVLTFVFGAWSYTYSSTNQNAFLLTVTAIQAPIESSLTALLAVVLALASFRLFQRRRGLLPVVFVISAVVFLLLNSGVLFGINSPLIGDVIFALRFLPLAGGRGILLGIALGSILAGLRILFGVERPYSG